MGFMKLFICFLLHSVQAASIWNGNNDYAFVDAEEDDVSGYSSRGSGSERGLYELSSGQQGMSAHEFSSGHTNFNVGHNPQIHDVVVSGSAEFHLFETKTNSTPRHLFDTEEILMTSQLDTTWHSLISDERYPDDDNDVPNFGFSSDGSANVESRRLNISASDENQTFVFATIVSKQHEEIDTFDVEAEIQPFEVIQKPSIDLVSGWKNWWQNRLTSAASIFRLENEKLEKRKYIDRVVCEDGKTCLNNGSCEIFLKEYRCACSEGYTGEDCGFVIEVIV